MTETEIKTARVYPELERFAGALDACTKCGFCMSACPVYREQKIESSVARGKIMLVRALREGDIELTREFSKKLDLCTLCGTCAANCPAGTDVTSIITAARAERVAEKGIPFPYSFIYRTLLPRRILFGRVVRVASWLQGIFLPRTKGTIRHLAFFLSAFGKGRHIPQLAKKFLRQSVPEINCPPDGVKTVARVGYFTGCMTDFVFPDAGKKLISFLTRNGVEVLVPRGQGCCGAPVFLGAGDFATGRRFAEANIEAFRDVDVIITDCATCASAMKDYARYLADTEERKVRYTAFAAKIHDITEYLVDVLKLPDSAYHVRAEFKGKSVTWHEPCHLGRHLGIKDAPRQILNASPDIKFVEMPEADRCCGMAGTFSVYFYDISKKIADRKIDNILRTSADIVVTDCPGCQIQLIDGITRRGATPQVFHIMELFE